jgi:hypothetical protein
MADACEKIDVNWTRIRDGDEEMRKLKDGGVSNDVALRMMDPRQCRLDLAENRYYYSVTWQSINGGGVRVQHAQDDSFDGTYFYHRILQDGVESHEPMMLDITQSECVTGGARVGFDPEYLSAAGIEVVVLDEKLFRFRCKSRVLLLEECGCCFSVAPSIVGGNQVNIETWKDGCLLSWGLDPQRGFALVSFQELVPSGISRRMVVSSLREVVDGTWFPVEIKSEYFQWKEHPAIPTQEPLFVERLHVNNIEMVSADLSEFVLTIQKPGRPVFKTFLNEEGERVEDRYLVAAEVDDLDQSIGTLAKHRQSLDVRWSVVTALGIGVVTLWRLLRRNRAAAVDQRAPT